MITGLCQDSVWTIVLIQSYNPRGRLSTQRSRSLEQDVAVGLEYNRLWVPQNGSNVVSGECVEQSGHQIGPGRLPQPDVGSREARVDFDHPILAAVVCVPKNQIYTDIAAQAR